ncbi:MAG: hypothetical protein ACRD4B_08290, partial [Acidobacteriota bacterium]
AMETAEVLRQMNDWRVRPTISAETLAFARHCPKAPKRGNLIGLGSDWSAGRIQSVLCVSLWTGAKALSLELCDTLWYLKDTSFLVVPMEE